MNSGGNGDLKQEAVRVVEEFQRQRNSEVLTVAFTDIAKSTQLREELGEEVYENLRINHEVLVNEIVTDGNEGDVVKGTGDGALIVFEKPSVAVERMLELQEATASHEHFRLRIGIDLGEVHPVNDGKTLSDVFGRHVNRASRIQGVAEPGHILTSFTVYDCAVGWLINKGVEWHSHGKIALRGVRDKQELLEPFLSGKWGPQASVEVPKGGEDFIAQGVRDRPMFSREASSSSAGKIPSRPKILLSPERNVNGLKIRPTSIPMDTNAGDLLGYFGGKISSSAKKYRAVFGQDPNILWVDDCPENNSHLAKVLCGSNCSVQTAKSTHEGLNLLRRQRYGAVITDMGRGDEPDAGLDFLSQMRNEKFNEPTIVFSSLNAVSRYGRAAKRRGAVLCTSGFVSLLDGLRQILDWWNSNPNRFR